MSGWASKRAIDIVESRYVTQKYFLDLDQEARETQQDITLTDLLTKPQVWVDWANVLRPGDLCRVIGAGIDVMLAARSIMRGSGCIMEIAFERSRLGTPLGDAIARAEMAVRHEERELLMAQAMGATATNGAAKP
jgi:hypothetical protein